MCNCIKEVAGSVKDLNNYNLVELDCIVTNTKNNQKLTGQRIDVSYNHVMKNGGIRRKYKKSFISHVFCPFCGVKYQKNSLVGLAIDLGIEKFGTTCFAELFKTKRTNPKRFDMCYFESPTVETDFTPALIAKGWFFTN